MKNVYLFSDVDGTLMTEHGEIPEANKEAIKKFINDGGNFAIATGRGIRSAREIANELGTNCPCIIFNGTVVYDFQKEELISIEYLPESGKQLGITSKAFFPNVTVNIATMEEYYTIGEDAFPNAKRAFTPVFTSFEDIKEQWIKVVYYVMESDRDELVAYLNKHKSDDIFISVSGANFVEILPLNSNKGTAMMKLRESMTSGVFHAIGDYNNDLQMLEVADRTACPITAIQEVRDISENIVASVQDGAVADYIRIIYDEVHQK